MVHAVNSRRSRISKERHQISVVTLPEIALEVIQIQIPPSLVTASETK